MLGEESGLRKKTEVGKENLDMFLSEKEFKFIERGSGSPVTASPAPGQQA